MFSTTRMRFLSSTMLVLWTAPAQVASVSQQTDNRHVVIVSADASDARLAASREAIAFWNQTLSDLQLRTRLVEGEVLIASPGALHAYARDLSAGDPSAPPAAGNGLTLPRPQELINLDGDIVVVLTTENIISSTRTTAQPTRVFISIRTDQTSPLNLPNVPRNVIAHELGHALGLDHNSDPMMLMCGRPASCRPERYQSAERKIFPLTAEDSVELRRLHGTP